MDTDENVTMEYAVGRREVTTHVIVKNGQSIVLSGIVRKEDFEDVRKVPLLGDLPGDLGKLFRSIDKGARNRELVLLVTPTVLQTDAEIDAHSAKPLRLLRELGADPEFWPELKDKPLLKKAGQ
jgi:type II secretory pathway component GspD/PulD (secretin)